MRRNRLIPVLAHAGMALFLSTGDALAYDLRGHVKLQTTAADYPEDSLFQEFSDDPARDAGLDLRANLAGENAGWRWHVDYQLVARAGDQVELQQQNPGFGFGNPAAPEDDARVFDLEHRISEDDDRIVSHRLDRFYAGYSSERGVVNIGRQAVSWGNGLIYNPVDFFNPFDPAAIDTEYKTGDDMIYSQYLFDSGDDLQAVWVGRRDDDDDVSADVSSLAVKYHGFAPAGEYDLLLAEHFDAQMFALGGAVDHADAVWRGDILVTDSGGDRVESLVLNWSYSWVAWNKNLSATVEYYHNGFGIGDGDYSPAALAQNPELVERVTRGELFTLGENYLAATATLELNPLWLATVTLFRNLDDDSMLLQILSQHDLEQDLQLWLSLNLPSGDDGSEFGGIDSTTPERPLAVDASLFAQLAWYF